MLVSPNQLPGGETAMPAETTPASLGAITLEEYVSPGAIAEVPAEQATLGFYDGNAQDETGWKSNDPS